MKNVFKALGLVLLSSVAMAAPPSGGGTGGAKASTPAPLQYVDTNGKALGLYMGVNGALPDSSLAAISVNGGTYALLLLPVKPGGFARSTTAYIPNRVIYFANVGCTGQAYADPIIGNVVGIPQAVLLETSSGGRFLYLQPPGSVLDYANVSSQNGGGGCVSTPPASILLVPVTTPPIDWTGQFTEPLTLR